MLNMTNITHLTSAHDRHDIRIYVKMCCSLAKKSNYNVHLVVADGIGDEISNSVNIIDIGERSGSRLSRMTKTSKRMFQVAKKLDSDIYHLHDPELLPVGLKLKALGKKVIFDSHEDVGKDILSKEWIPFIIRKLVSVVYSSYEKYVCKKLDYIVAATPFIRDKFLDINKKSMDINNFPILGELANNVAWSEKQNQVCYVGGIAEIRGIKEIVKAMENTEDVSLHLAGEFFEDDVEKEVKNYKGWGKVNELGFIGRKEIVDLYKSSQAGLVTLHPIINYLDALPVKMFEYMSAGLPVISSDIPLWKSIIEDAKCGICVDPYNPQAIADAITYITTHPKEAEIMGKNGIKAIYEKYNWNQEEKKLYKLYHELER